MSGLCIIVLILTTKIWCISRLIIKLQLNHEFLHSGVGWTNTLTCVTLTFCFLSSRSGLMKGVFLSFLRMHISELLMDKVYNVHSWSKQLKLKNILMMPNMRCIKWRLWRICYKEELVCLSWHIAPECVCLAECTAHTHTQRHSPP